MQHMIIVPMKMAAPIVTPAMIPARAVDEDACLPPEIGVEVGGSVVIDPVALEVGDGGSVGRLGKRLEATLGSIVDAWYTTREHIEAIGPVCQTSDDEHMTSLSIQRL